MNPFYKAFCRVYQGVFYVVLTAMNFPIPEKLSGSGSISQLPKFIKERENVDKVLIVTDGGLMKLGMLDGLFQGLTDEKIEYALFDKVVPNPTIDNIEEAVLLYKEQGCQAIIAFGGGSSMDCAKGVGARIARPNKSITQMKGVMKIMKKLPPLFAIPTTAGTGSEATVAAVITDSKTHYKYPINDPVLIPKYAVLDPELTLKLPKHITSTTGMDALTHAVEAYIGRSNTKLTKDMSIQATKLIFDNIKLAYDDGANIEARTNMLTAAFYAGVSFTRAYVGYVHAIAHTLGGQYGIPHGLANAIILPHILEWFGESAYKKLAELADVVDIKGSTDEEKAKGFIAAIKEYNAYMNIPTTIDAIKEEDIPVMVERAYKEGNPLYPVPKLMSRDDFAAMFREIATNLE